MSLKLKDFLIPMSLSFSMIFLFRYFFSSEHLNAEKLESGRSFVAPRIQEVHRPLDLEIDFLDTKLAQEPVITQIETDYAKYLFSSDGAAITKLEYKHSVNGKEILLKAVDSQAREDRALLIAFSGKTPFHYKFVNKEEGNDDFVLTYQAEFDSGTITKKFIIYKHLCRLNLEINISTYKSSSDIQESKTLNEPIRLRIFYPSPLFADLSEDLVQGITNEGNDINKKVMSSLLQKYWEIPSLFGLEDKYFIHSMIKDSNNFAQRGYYKSIGANQFAAILEGPAIKEQSSWMLSFYFGPKKVGTIYNVDPRLEVTLDYGYLAPIAKPLLAILTFIYKYFHNYGIAIILLTLLIKLLLLPFTLKGEQSMKKRMEFQRKLQYLQQKYKNDKEALSQARAELLKKHGVADMAGCLPLLFQLPIFIALNRVLSSSIELYREPFLWIPSLALKDPYYILPILSGLSIVALSTASEPRQRLSTYAMALLIAAFTAGLPAGLSLFIFVSSALTVAQTKLFLYFKKA